MTDASSEAREHPIVGEDLVVGEGGVQPKEGYTSRGDDRSDSSLNQAGNPEPNIGWEQYRADQADHTFPYGDFEPLPRAQDFIDAPGLDQKLTLGVEGVGEEQNGRRLQHAEELRDYVQDNHLREPFGLALVQEHNGDISSVLRDEQRLREEVIRFRDLTEEEAEWTENIDAVNAEMIQLRALIPDSREAVSNASDAPRAGEPDPDDTAVELPEGILERLREGHARDLATELDAVEARDAVEVRSLRRDEQGDSFRAAVSDPPAQAAEQRRERFVQRLARLFGLGRSAGENGGSRELGRVSVTPGLNDTDMPEAWAVPAAEEPQDAPTVPVSAPRARPGL